MTPLQALQAATIHAAELLDVNDDRGRIQPGLIADLVAMPGNAPEDIIATERPIFVMMGQNVVVRR